MNRPDKVPSRQCNPGTEGFAVLGFRITLRFGVAWAARVPKMLGLSDAFPTDPSAFPEGTWTLETHGTVSRIIFSQCGNGGVFSIQHRL